MTVGNNKKKTVFTQGISPYFLDTDQITELLLKELKPKLKNVKVDEIYYYGTGCANPDNARSVKKAVSKVFEKAKELMIADYTWNSIQGNIEFTMMYSGDPAFYKDLDKRTASAIATGTDNADLSDKKEFGEFSVGKEFSISISKDIEKQNSCPYWTFLYFM